MHCMEDLLGGGLSDQSDGGREREICLRWRREPGLVEQKVPPQRGHHASLDQREQPVQMSEKIWGFGEVPPKVKSLERSRVGGRNPAVSKLPIISA